MKAGWAAAPPLWRAIVMSAALPVAALLFGRVDLLLLAVPFALGTAAALLTRPEGDPVAELELGSGSAVEGDPVDARLMVTNPGPAPVLCVLSPRSGRFLHPRYGSRHLLVELPPHSRGGAALGYTAARWGVHEVGPARASVFAADGLLEHSVQVAAARQVTALPSAPGFSSRVGLPDATGMSGVHRSRRSGENGELSGVRPFQPGDRLRRINWRTTVRTGQAHVNAMLSERDTEVVILVDVLSEVGVSGGVGGEESALDAAVRAAAAITGHYTHQGDRVAIVELGRPRRLRPGTGRRHYLAALQWLAGVRQAAGLGEESRERLLASGLITRAGLIVLLTPLVDERSATALAVLARSRRALIAVDTLPPGQPVPGDSETARLAERLWRIERDNVIGRLREAGVPVEVWRGAGSLDAILRDAARVAR